jgi:myo-inositol-1(or 4)-monophosphatase
VNFLYGLGSWSVSIACEDASGAMVGVVHHPTTGETFRASRGGGAWLDDRQLAVSSVRSLAETLVATGFSYDPAARADQGAMIGALLPEVRDVRRCGSAALDLAWCASGRFDAYLEFGLHPWDWAAGSLLVREAGGVVTEHHRRLGGSSRLGLIAGGRASHDGLADWVEARA